MVEKVIAFKKKFTPRVYPKKFTKRCKQGGSEIQPFEIREHLKSALFEGLISNGLVFKWSGFSYCYSYSPNHLKTGPFAILAFLSVFQMVFDKMAAICLDFRWLGFQISDPIRNPDHFQTNLFLTIQNFRSPLY